MSILTTNLKIYNPLEHRSDKTLFLKNIGIGFLVLMFSGRALYELNLYKAILHNQYSFTTVSYLFFAMYFMGMTVASIRLDIITKPFSYCLPDTYNTHRKVIFLIAGMIVLMLSLASFLFSEKSFLIFAIGVAIISVSVLPGYFFGIFQLIYFQNKKANQLIILLSLPVLILQITPLIMGDDIKLPLSRYLTVCIFPLALSSAMGMTALWKMLNDKDLKNIFFGKEYSLSGNFNKFINAGDVALANKLQVVEDNDDPERSLLLDKVHHMPLSSTFRHFMGALYSIKERSMRISAKASIAQVLFLYLLALLTGYNQNTNHPMGQYLSFAVVFIACFSFSILSRYPAHNIFLPVDRLKQYFTSLIFWIIKPAVAILFFGIAILSSYALQNIAPDIIIPGHIFSYAPVTWLLLGWIMVVTPIIDIFTGFKEPPCGTLSIACLIVAVFILGMFFNFTHDHSLKMILMTSMIIISNIFYLFILTRYWLKRDAL